MVDRSDFGRAEQPGLYVQRWPQSQAHAQPEEAPGRTDRCGARSGGVWGGLLDASRILLRLLIEREFGVLYNRHYVCELLRNLGYAFQKARFVSDHLDEAARQAWIQVEWPRLLQAARRQGAKIMFGDEASFPQWGSLSYTWARRGQQPTVKTSGVRKGYKVFGVIDYFSGRFFYQASDGKFTSETYQAFLRTVLCQTRGPLFLIQDGAKYHTSKATRAFFEAQPARLTVFQLPSYSPDYNPIEERPTDYPARARQPQQHQSRPS